MNEAQIQSMVQTQTYDGITISFSALSTINTNRAFRTDGHYNMETKEFTLSRDELPSTHRNELSWIEKKIIRNVNS